MIMCSVASLYCPKHEPKAGCRNTPLPEHPFSLALSTDYKSYVITLQPRVAGGFRNHFAGGGTSSCLQAVTFYRPTSQRLLSSSPNRVVKFCLEAVERMGTLTMYGAMATASEGDDCRRCR